MVQMVRLLANFQKETCYGPELHGGILTYGSEIYSKLDPQNKFSGLVLDKTADFHQFP